MNDGQSKEILLAFDFGLARIGIATANLRTKTASPLTTLRNGRMLPWADLDRLIDQWAPSQLVVGLPSTRQETPFSSSAKAFAQSIHEKYQLPVAIIDESLTSRAASAELREARHLGFLPRRIKKNQIDSWAACLIARQWMSDQTDECKAVVP